MGDHLLVCGHGPLRIRRHDALRQVLYHALLNDHPGVRIEQLCGSDRQLRPGDVFYPSFQNGKLGYFDVTVRNTLQPAFLMRGAEQAGIAAEAGVAVKDHLHAAAVEESGGEFHLIVVEWCVASVLLGHASRDRVASNHLHVHSLRMPMDLMHHWQPCFRTVSAILIVLSTVVAKDAISSFRVQSE